MKCELNHKQNILIEGNNFFIECMTISMNICPSYKNTDWGSEESYHLNISGAVELKALNVVSVLKDCIV